MARDPMFQTAPIVFVRFKDEFSEPDYTIPVQTPFELSNTFSSMQLEAQSKGKCLAIQASLVDISQYFGTDDQKEGSNNEPTATQ